MEYVKGAPVTPVDTPRKLLDIAVQESGDVPTDSTTGNVTGAVGGLPTRRLVLTRVPAIQGGGRYLNISVAISETRWAQRLASRSSLWGTPTGTSRYPSTPMGCPRTRAPRQRSVMTRWRMRSKTAEA